jgi:hypothetical protein
MLRLLRCRFWKSEPSRGPPIGSSPPKCGGVSILMTLAPQSASWRTQVGPERTRVRSSTVKRERACLTSFNDFGLVEPINRALVDEKYVTPTPIQAQTIPLAMPAATSSASPRPAPARPRPSRCRSCIASGNRIKPAAREEICRVLVLSPDARIVGADPRQLQRLWPPHAPHFGAGDRRRADGNRQVRSLMQGVEVMVATPGRLLDLVQSNGAQARTGRVPGARRSRPHARHGLHQRHPEDRGQTAGQAADAVLLGHHAARISPARRFRCCAIRPASP